MTIFLRSRFYQLLTKKHFKVRFSQLILRLWNKTKTFF